MAKKVLFKVENMTKSYPGTIALQDINLEIHEGEVVGIVGENGAGKSTLLKIIMGCEKQSSGNMWAREIKYAPKTPSDANKLGVGMVFQEQSLITNLTVGQNIFFGNEKEFKRFGLINWKKMYDKTEKVLESLDLNNIQPKKKIGELDFATRQMVEIAKVLNSAMSSSENKCLILLDEPTSVLNEDEIKQLFSHVKKLREEGNAIVFISHRLDEIIEISDRVYIFKDGKNNGMLEKEKQNINEMTLYEMMVGKTTSGEYYKVERQVEPRKKIVFEARQLGLLGSFKDVSFKLHESEIISICGVIGSGKEELCSVINGDESLTSGEIYVEGKKCNFRSPCDALKSGVISIPMERREEGIVGSLSIYENICLSNFNLVKRNGFISKRKQIEQSKEWIKKLNIKCLNPNDLVSKLSGGNAQKIVFSRILASKSKVLVLNHPTRGVDVGAKEEIYSLIRDITEKGHSVILLGDTLNECIGLSNRILVMKDGFITKEYNASIENKPEQVDIVKYMM